MAFHGDYEIEFEIYETTEGVRSRQPIGYMVGVDSQDAKIRWVEANEVTPERYDQIVAVFPTSIWK
tara:strand:+ start:7122 stop:7319 length:198 start_codon:yes stop_codon:yes gene_type:complete